MLQNFKAFTTYTPITALPPLPLRFAYHFLSFASPITATQPCTPITATQPEGGTGGKEMVMLGGDLSILQCYKFVEQVLKNV